MISQGLFRHQLDVFLVSVRHFSDLFERFQEFLVFIGGFELETFEFRIIIFDESFEVVENAALPIFELNLLMIKVVLHSGHLLEKVFLISLNFGKALFVCFEAEMFSRFFELL